MDGDKLFDADVLQSIAGAKSLNSFFISNQKIARVFNPELGGIPECPRSI